jgi:cytidylate kinase
VARSIVCISQTTGSNGEEVGHAVAERLGFRHLDEEIVVRAARREKIEPEEMASVERRQTFARRFLRSLDRRAKLETFAHSVLFPDEDAERPSGSLPLATSEELRAAIRAAIHETSEQGDVVIVSHAASIALAGMPGVLRVLVTASPKTRAGRLAEASKDKLDSSKALRLVRETDRARADYMKRFYALRQEEPTCYDLVINTDVLDPDEAVDLIVVAARGSGE